MKKSLRPYLFLAAAVILALVVLSVDRPDDSHIATKTLHPFASLVTEQVKTLEIEQLLDGVVLRNADGVWTVAALETAIHKKAQGEGSSVEDLPIVSEESFPADGERVAEVLRALHDLKTGAVVSRDKDKHAQLLVGPLGMQVRAKDGEGHLLALLYIGKQGPDYFSTYVRAADVDEVYLVQEQLHGRFPMRVDDWRNKRLWKLDADHIARVSVDHQGGGFAMQKNDAGLFTLEGAEETKPLDVTKLQGWLSRWTDLRVVEFVSADDAKKADFAKPEYTLQVVMNDGTKHTLVLGNDAPNGSPYARLDAGKEVYVVPTSLRSALQVDPVEWELTQDSASK